MCVPDAAPERRLPSEGDPSPALRSALRRLSEPSRALPDSVDGTIRQAIAAHEFEPRRLRLPWVTSQSMRWAAAAAIAVSAGAWLGWTPVASEGDRMVASGSGRPSPATPAPSTIDSAQRTTTIIDAFLAAQVVARLRTTPDTVHESALLARFDADGDGHISERDVALLVRRAVAVEGRT